MAPFTPLHSSAQKQIELSRQAWLWVMKYQASAARVLCTGYSQGCSSAGGRFALRFKAIVVWSPFPRYFPSGISVGFG